LPVIFVAAGAPVSAASVSSGTAPATIVAPSNLESVISDLLGSWFAFPDMLDRVAKGAASEA
jgi:hypothetical protein